MSLVTIKRSETDSSKTVWLNQHGLAKIEELRKTLKEIEESLLQGLSDDEIKLLNNVFTKLVQKTEKSTSI